MATFLLILGGCRGIGAALISFSVFEGSNFLAKMKLDKILNDYIKELGI
jgi:hypothetical protein